MDDRRHAYWYAAVALPAALLFAFLTPPLQTPDEVGHYWRAVAIGRGQLIADKVEGRPGGMIPADVRDLVFFLWMDMAGRPVKYETDRLHRALTLRPSSETVRLVYPSFYTAVPYFPQAAAVAVTRLFRAPTLVSFYAGRVANAVAGVLLVMIAMRLAPVAAWIFGAVGSTPMFLYLAGSFSADVATVGAAFCATAAGIRLWQEPPRGVGTFGVAAVLSSLTKPAYVLMAVTSLPALRSREMRPKLVVVLCLVLAAVAVAAWTTSAAYYPMRSDVFTDARQQSAHVVRYPFQFLRVAASDYAAHARMYYEQFIGRLGWLDIGLPPYVRIVYALLFLYVTFTAGLSPRLTERLLLLAIFAATLLVVSLSQYLIWTPVNADEIHGIQGRYFLPVAPLALLAAAQRRWKPRIAVPLIVAVAGNAAALYALWRHYY
jgi:uncharacterized membrane protein